VASGDIVLSGGIVSGELGAVSCGDWYGGSGAADGAGFSSGDCDLSQAARARTLMSAALIITGIFTDLAPRWE
jgi:hypothetical protein